MRPLVDENIKCLRKTELMNNQTEPLSDPVSETLCFTHATEHKTLTDFVSSRLTSCFTEA